MFFPLTTVIAVESVEGVPSTVSSRALVAVMQRSLTTAKITKSSRDSIQEVVLGDVTLGFYLAGVH